MIYTLTTLLSLLIGYYLGSQRSLPEDVQRMRKELKKKLETSDVGAVRRPSAQQIYKRNHPEVAEEEAAMRETLKKELR